MTGNGRGFTRRGFVRTSAAAGAALGLAGTGLSAFAEEEHAKKAGKTLLILGGTAFLGPQL
ncbi:MAG TPA: twin-arginine translocation signal domain-containing protein, partial [Thermoanaerobaculia bacterium]|nr:twin-arginine translocation signal domain-containing protein [Thermoanaerobaculia bacterium]